MSLQRPYSCTCPGVLDKSTVRVLCWDLFLAGSTEKHRKSFFGWGPNKIGERHKPRASRVVLQSTALVTLISPTVKVGGHFHTYIHSTSCIYLFPPYLDTSVSTHTNPTHPPLPHTPYVVLGAEGIRHLGLVAQCFINRLFQQNQNGIVAILAQV